MKQCARFGAVLLLAALFATPALFAAAPAASQSECFVMVQELALWSDVGNWNLKWQDNLTIGDKLNITGQPGKYKVEGVEKEYLKVKTMSGKEGWVRSSLVVSNATLAVVKADSSIIYSEPRDVKITAESLDQLQILAVHKDGAVDGFLKVSCYDAKKDIVRKEVYISRDDITSDDVDINAVILYKVALAQKKAELKKNLLTLASTKYAKSIFSEKIKAALGGNAPAAGAPKTIVPATGKYLVNDSKVNVRDKPDEVNGKVIALVNSPDAVEIIETTKESYTIGGLTAPWFHIAAPDGWVFGSFLTPAP